jgi:imidazolonepropionase-like amidohydrolase
MERRVKRGWTQASIALSVLALLASAVGCAPPAPPRAPRPRPIVPTPLPDAPWRVDRSRTAHKPKAPTLFLRGARLHIGDGTTIESGYLLLKDGKIAAIGKGDGQVPPGAKLIDARGKHITPGLIDTHSHLGVYPSPSAEAHRDGNEASEPVTASVRARDGFWVQDPDIERAVAGGVTTVQILPGSANLIGGRAVTLKLRHAATLDRMLFDGAPTGLKMACGENPKRVYGTGRKSKPMTRMGNVAMQRDAFMRARRLIEEWDQFRDSERQRYKKQRQALAEVRQKRAAREKQRAECASGKHTPKRCKQWEEQWKAEPIKDPDPLEPKLPPKRDPELETLAAALEGKILVHVHCYRADDMANMLTLSDEVGFSIRSFHHALEAYKIRDELVRRRISVSTWADWWGFKMEAYDGIPENLAMIAGSGGLAVVHSDSAEGIRRLNQEAAKGMYSGKRSGIEVSEGEAMKWITSNPAWTLGVDARVGSLTVGKDADVVIWDKDPFSVYARAERVFIDGMQRYDAADKRRWSDFEAAP